MALAARCSVPTVRTFAAAPASKKKKNQERKGKKNQGDDSSNLQHEEWVKFQNSISIDGFETGQTTTVQANIGQKRRGGKAVRKRMQKSAELTEQEQEYNIGGGQYPPLRYSEEETERLLKEAYANIPKRDGKRGTRNLQRQSNRWHKVRQARKIAKKNYGIKQHERRMLKRSQVVSDVKQVKVDAVGIRELEQAYQGFVASQWTKIMFAEDETDGGEKQDSV
eukprot:CAMPEP_0119029696 /NCGR_PEP_ID=MMETSP1176-20130426/40652_1 /TAXON_ID=265551 /ORGANISM="Synedropsis recta cf, Strain CCMP1620" /LENGTH=222 /DNA_ID=CAMNT_0006986047 /DNA_START=92 /DNA_END=760 /DNA_ORIENTATION=-